MLEYRSAEAHEERQTAIESGFAAEWMGASFGNSTKGRESFKRNTVIISFDQVYYTVRAEVPFHPSQLFRRAASREIEQLVLPTNPLGMVTEVAYGRKSVIRVTGEASHDQLLQAVQYSFDQARAPKLATPTDTQSVPSLSVDDPRIPKVSVTKQQELAQTLTSSTITVAEVGGPLGPGMKTIKDGNLSAVFSDTTGGSPTNPGYPVSYTVRNVGSRDILRLGYGTEFDLFQCQPYEAELRVTADNLFVAVSAGDNTNGEVYGTVDANGQRVHEITRSRAVAVPGGRGFTVNLGGSTTLRLKAMPGNNLRVAADWWDSDGLSPDDPLGRTEALFPYSRDRWGAGGNHVLQLRAGSDGVDIRFRVEELNVPSDSSLPPREGPSPLVARPTLHSAVSRTIAADAGSMHPSTNPGVEEQGPPPIVEPPIDSVQTVPSTELRARLDAVSVVRDDVPLDPGTGGRSILEAVLRPGDLIVSTTPQGLSAAVRRLTGAGPVSHVRLYMGQGYVLEALPGEGVRLAKLSEVLQADDLAVGVRVPGLTSGQARTAVDFAMSQLGKPYDYVAAASDARFRFGGREVSVNFGSGTGRRFTCSTLIVTAFESAGRQLGTLTGKRSPNDLATLRFVDALDYVGHLKYTPTR